MNEVMFDRDTHTTADMLDIYVWLKDSGLAFGEDWHWEQQSGSSKIKFFFLEEEHATLFMLKWI